MDLVFTPPEPGYSTASFTGYLTCFDGVPTLIFPWLGEGQEKLSYSPSVSAKKSAGRVRRKTPLNSAEKQVSPTSPRRAGAGAGAGIGSSPREDSEGTPNSSWLGQAALTMAASIFLTPMKRKENREGVQQILIFCHGKSSDIGGCSYLQEWANSLKMTVLAIEYPGYGIWRKEGVRPSADGIDQALNKVYKYVTSVLGWKAEQVCVAGRSLGTGPACKLASLQSLGGLILISPFTTLSEAASDAFHLPLPLIKLFLPGEGEWDTSDYIKRVNCPTLILHGQEDDIVPQEHSMALYDIICNEIVERHHEVHMVPPILGILPETDHNTFDWEHVCDHYISGFLEKCRAFKGIQESDRRVFRVPKSSYEGLCELRDATSSHHEFFERCCMSSPFLEAVSREELDSIRVRHAAYT